MSELTPSQHFKKIIGGPIGCYEKFVSKDSLKLIILQNDWKSKKSAEMAQEYFALAESAEHRVGAGVPEDTHCVLPYPNEFGPEHLEYWNTLCHIQEKTVIEDLEFLQRAVTKFKGKIKKDLERLQLVAKYIRLKAERLSQ